MRRPALDQPIYITETIMAVAISEHDMECAPCRFLAAVLIERLDHL